MTIEASCLFTQTRNGGCITNSLCSYAKSSLAEITHVGKVKIKSVLKCTISCNTAYKLGDAKNLIEIKEQLVRFNGTHSDGSHTPFHTSLNVIMYVVEYRIHFLLSSYGKVCMEIKHHHLPYIQSKCNICCANKKCTICTSPHVCEWSFAQLIAA